MFQPGHKKIGGKKIGSVNKRTKEFEAILEKHNFIPAEAQIEVYRRAEIDYEEAHEIQDIDLALKALKIMSETSRDLCAYAYPKLKAIDFKRNGEWVSLSLYEQYNAAKALTDNLQKQLQLEDKKC